MIAMLVDGRYPNDIRVRKEAESLAENGLKVLVIATYHEGEQRSEEINGVQVFRIGKHQSFFRMGIRQSIQALFFIDFMFLKHARRIIRTERVTHLHIHDLPLAKTGLKLRKLIPGKLILDNHENFPELLVEMQKLRKPLFVRWKDRLLFNAKRWLKYEAKMVAQFDHVILVVDEMRNKFIERYHLDLSRVWTFANYEKKEFSQKVLENQKDDFIFDPETFYILYVGGIDTLRGLTTVISSLRVLKEQGYKASFIALGSGRTALLESLKQQAVDEGVQEDVYFLGHKPFGVVNYYMQRASVNIIPHERNPHTDFTIPHKLFQILMSKRPILVSSCPPLARYVKTSDGGWVYEASNPTDLAQKIIQIRESGEEEIERRAMNAYTYVMNHWTWDDEGKRLAEFYRGLDQ